MCNCFTIKEKNRMRLSIAVLIFSIALIGCSSSYIVSSTPHDDELSFSKLNAETKNKSATIVFQDDSKLDCQEVLSAADSTSWLEPTTGARAAVPTFKIKKIFLRIELSEHLMVEELGS